jgi:glycosyltransferase involved in cell wall biosynthesis
MKHTLPFVSIIIPCRNERRYISGCVESLLKQDYPRRRFEILVMDGMSQDGTREILKKLDEVHKIRFLDNPKRTVPFALNTGVEKSKGSIIMRMDAHTEYPKFYIRKCVDILEKTKAWNVGGYCITRGRTFMGKAIALAMGSLWGVGNSEFRLGRYEGEVDTVPFGTWPRWVFKKLGLFDTRLVRNQDYEFNHRIRAAGGKVYLSRSVHSYYYARDTLPGIASYFYSNSMHNVISTRIMGQGFLKLRHFLPFIALIIGIIILVLSVPVFLGLCCAYLLISIVFGLILSFKPGLRYLPALLVVFPTIHLSYALGITAGILKSIFPQQVSKA